MSTPMLVNTSLPGPRGCHARGSVEGTRVDFRFNSNVTSGKSGSNHTILCEIYSDGNTTATTTDGLCPQGFVDNYLSHVAKMTWSDDCALNKRYRVGMCTNSDEFSLSGFCYYNGPGCRGSANCHLRRQTADLSKPYGRCNSNLCAKKDDNRSKMVPSLYPSLIPYIIHSKLYTITPNHKIETLNHTHKRVIIFINIPLTRNTGTNPNLE